MPPRRHDPDDNPYEFTGTLIHETELAYLIDDGTAERWLPKSQTTDNGDGTFKIPEWLAIKSGMV